MFTDTLEHLRDADLAGKVKKGSRAAADVLVRRHTGLVHSAVKSFGKLPASVERDDLVQVGLVAIIAAALQFTESGSKFSTYAFTAVRNSVLDELKVVTSLPAYVGPEKLWGVPEPEGDEDAGTVNGMPAGTRLRLARALKPLTKEQRDFLFAVFGVGSAGEVPSLREIARRLGHSHGTVQNRVKRLLVKVRAKAGRELVAT